MPQTPTGVTTPYALAADLFIYHDPAQVADYIRNDPDARPTVSAMSITSSGYGLTLFRILLAASGKLETACLVGERYTPADLQALLAAGTGTNPTFSGTELLIKTTCDLAFWFCAQRRVPNSGDPRNVPGAAEALENLEKLKNGEWIFGFIESAKAGLPTVQQANPLNLLTPNVVARARRLFPFSGPNALPGTPQQGGDG